MDECDKCSTQETEFCTCNMTWDQIEMQKLRNENEKLKNYINAIESEIEESSNFDDVPGSWNYRIVLTKDSENSTYMTIHEIYYDSNGNPIGKSESPAHLSASSFTELVEVYEKIKDAFTKPIILSNGLEDRAS
jgi:hypothetical protein